MRIVFALSGLHRVLRGAEVAFESLAQELGTRGEDDVLLLGSGAPRPGRAYRFEHVPAVSRERFQGWPTAPFLRSPYAYEELTFAAGMLARGQRERCDVTVTCSYPYTSWALRARHPGRSRPAHVFVTQSGDWPAYEPGREGRFFRCDGLVCTNRPYFERNRELWFCALIPNGVDPDRFHPGREDRAAIGVPEGRPVVLMACALVEGKLVLEGMRAVAGVEDAFLVVAGDGPLASEVDRLALEVLPGRFLRRVFPHDQMPAVYRSASAFLQPGFPESFGNVYVEALASGLPVVANDNPSTRWIFDGHGFLTDTTSESHLRDAIRRALRSPGADASARAAFAADRYAWRSVAARYREFLEEVTRRRRRR